MQLRQAARRRSLRSNIRGRLRAATAEQRQTSTALSACVLWDIKPLAASAMLLRRLSVLGCVAKSLINGGPGEIRTHDLCLWRTRRSSDFRHSGRSREASARPSRETSLKSLKERRAAADKSSGPRGEMLIRLVTSIATTKEDFDRRCAAISETHHGSFATVSASATSALIATGEM
jgi:hypothetical protein